MTSPTLPAPFRVVNDLGPVVSVHRFRMESQWGMVWIWLQGTAALAAVVAAGLWSDPWLRQWGLDGLGAIVAMLAYILLLAIGAGGLIAILIRVAADFFVTWAWRKQIVVQYQEGLA